MFQPTVRMIADRILGLRSVGGTWLHASGENSASLQPDTNWIVPPADGDVAVAHRSTTG